MKRSARRYPANEMRGSGITALWQRDQPRARHIVIEVPGSLVFERRRVVHLDLETGAVDVELLAVGRHAEVESRAARNLCGLRNPVRAQVERPKLAAAVAVLAV